MVGEKASFFFKNVAPDKLTKLYLRATHPRKNEQYKVDLINLKGTKHRRKERKKEKKTYFGS